MKTAAVDDIAADHSKALDSARNVLEIEADRVYETYVKPLEQDHWGEYIAVSRDGKLLLGASLEDLTEEAVSALGRGHFAFRIGALEVGKVR